MSLHHLMMIETDSLILIDIMCCDDTILLSQMRIIRIDESTTIEWLRRIFELTN